MTATDQNQSRRRYDTIRTVGTRVKDRYGRIGVVYRVPRNDPSRVNVRWETGDNAGCTQSISIQKVEVDR